MYVSVKDIHLTKRTGVGRQRMSDSAGHGCGGGVRGGGEGRRMERRRGEGERRKRLEENIGRECGERKRGVKGGEWRTHLC